MRASVVVAAVVFVLGAEAANKHGSTKDRAYRTKKRECEVTAPCRDMAPDTNMNCVNECISPKCFGDVYAAEPLEDGEVDAKRGRQFVACVRKEHASRRRDEQKDRAERRSERKRQARGKEA